MKKKVAAILTILVILIIVCFLVSAAKITAGRSKPRQYSCQKNSDCVSTCGAGCVNSEWAKSYEDPCRNIRVWDCTCVRKVCYTDSRPPMR